MEPAAPPQLAEGCGDVGGHGVAEKSKNREEGALTGAVGTDQHAETRDVTQIDVTKSSEVLEADGFDTHRGGSFRKEKSNPDPREPGARDWVMRRVGAAGGLFASRSRLRRQGALLPVQRRSRVLNPRASGEENDLAARAIRPDKSSVEGRLPAPQGWTGPSATYDGAYATGLVPCSIQFAENRSAVPRLDRLVARLGRRRTGQGEAA